CNPVPELGVPFKKCWIIKTILSRTRQEYKQNYLQKYRKLFLVVRNNVIIFFQTFHEDISDFVHFVLIFDSFKKFLAIYSNNLANYQLAAAIQRFLWIIKYWGKCHLTVVTVVNCSQNFRRLFNTVGTFQSQDVVAKFVTDHRAAAPFLSTPIIL